MDFSKLFKALDGIITVVEAVKGPKEEPPRQEQLSNTPTVGLAEQLQAGLTNVVVAALKEAFDRDQARLDMERAQIEEQRLRAEAALRMEARRLAADRDAGRLKILGGTALFGWIVDVALLVSRLATATTVSRIMIGAASLLLLSSLGLAFLSLSRISDPGEPESHAAHTANSSPLWLLLAGLALTVASLLV